ncbi:MAG: hypothetical protein M3003_16350, partial [Candidatus Dormibacteraeota bacterium]|nr:hypothetical protein [Candidatus Dormibacteraeota bacterium]
ELYAVSSEFVGLQTDTQEQKTKWLHFFGTIMAKSAWRSPYHGPSKAQLSGYVRRDLKIPQDWVMVKMLCAQMAMPDLPDRVFEQEPDIDTRDPEGEDVRFAGMGDDEVYAVEDEDVLLTSIEDTD